MELNRRQETILDIVKREGPITGEHIAERLNLTRATLRPDMAILTMAGLVEARPRVGYYVSNKPRGRLEMEHLHRVRVGDIKSVPVAVMEQCSVYDAAVTIFIEDVGTLFVVREGGILEGVVSRKDFLKVSLGGQDMHKLPVGVIMTRMPNVVVTAPEESVWQAAQKIMTHAVDALPVVRPVGGEDGQTQYEVIGRLSKTNITRLFVELGERG